MTIIDETTNGVAKTGVSRRHFIQGAAAMGTAAVLPATGLIGSGSAGAAASTLRVSIAKIQFAPTPYTTNDAGSLQLLCSVAEYLSFSNDKGEIAPRVAESWKGSNGGKTWTFKIRKGITFHDGSALTADDVVWSIKGHLDPANKSNASGKFAGILLSPGVVKVDKYTVRFDLQVAMGSFPYLLSSTSYGLIIIKNGADGGAAWEAKMNAAGPYVLDTYTKGEKCTFKKNTKYWDKTRQPAYDTLVVTSFESQEAAAAQILTGKLDATTGVTGATAAKLNKKKVDIVRVASASHLGTHLRTDFGPFMDKRVRQAAALTFDRPAFLAGALKGAGILGNDSVMAPFATNDKSVPQRKKDIAAAKKLMAAAGVPKGFKVDLSTYHRDDIDLLAQALQASFAEIGITVNLATISDNYYGGPSDAKLAKKVESHVWLESNFGITDFGHRGSPAEYLTRIFKSTGDWNAAHINDAKLDAACDEYIAATTPAKAMAASKKIQESCLDLTPCILPFFASMVAAVRKGLKGYYTNGMGQFDAAAVRG
jgi:peptide/nickel transport system substrate-binding protein